MDKPIGILRLLVSKPCALLLAQVWQCLLRDKYKAKQLNLNHKITLAKLLLAENVTLLTLAVGPLSNISFMV